MPQETKTYNLLRVGRAKNKYLSKSKISNDLMKGIFSLRESKKSKIVFIHNNK